MAAAAAAAGVAELIPNHGADERTTAVARLLVVRELADMLAAGSPRPDQALPLVEKILSMDPAAGAGGGGGSGGGGRRARESLLLALRTEAVLVNLRAGPAEGGGGGEGEGRRRDWKGFSRALRFFFEPGSTAGLAGAAQRRAELEQLRQARGLRDAAADAALARHSAAALERDLQHFVQRARKRFPPPFLDELYEDVARGYIPGGSAGAAEEALPAAMPPQKRRRTAARPQPSATATVGRGKRRASEGLSNSQEDDRLDVGDSGEQGDGDGSEGESDEEYAAGLAEDDDEDDEDEDDEDEEDDEEEGGEEEEGEEEEGGKEDGKEEEGGEVRGRPAPPPDSDDLNDDVCRACGAGGTLLLCEGCPASYHLQCAGVRAPPPGDWFCPECRGLSEELRPPAAAAAAAEASVGLSSVRRGGTPEELDDTTHLLFYASQGDVNGLAEVLRRGGDVNLADYDGRTALHLAASEGQLPALRLLLAHGAAINPTDRWGSTPLSDARHYDHLDAVKLLEAAGGKMGPLSRAPSPPVGQAGAVQGGGLPPPLEYEIDVSELDFSKSKPVGKVQGAFGEIHVVNWRGTRVAVKTILSTLSSQPQIVKEFREELTLLQKLRHPNIVQFLGAVTQTMPLMIVTEYLPKGDVAEYVRRKGALEASTAVSFALDIARGMNYLHEHRPDAIVHRDLKPRNLLRDDAGHLKVADFGLGKLLKAKADSIQEVYQMTGETGSYRYMAPEVFRHEAYHKSVDVFSFAIIVQEFFEGKQAFKFQLPEEIAQAIAFENLRPPFKARTYPPGMKGLLQECWDKDPKRRPTFTQILEQLELMERKLPPPADVIQQGCNCTVL
eukprot:SM000048S16556  [mRNA]  locus=s48:442986:449032:+ [translate_table: standard]